MKFLFKKIIGLSVIVPLVLGSGVEAFAANSGSGLAKIDFVNEKLIDVATGAKINDASEPAAKNWKAVNSGTSITAKIGDAEKTIYIGKDINVSTDETGFGTYEDTEIQDLVLPKREAAPAAVYDATEAPDVITAVTDSMEYKVGTGAYIAIGAGKTTLTRTEFGNFANTINIRTKATATAFASKPKEIKVVDAIVVAPTTVSYIPEIESLKGMKSTMEYRVKDAPKYIAGKDGNISVATLLAIDKEVVLEVRLKEVKPTKTSLGSPASEAKEITLPKRGAVLTAPAVDFVEEEVAVTATQEYSTDKVTWKTGTGTLDLATAKIIGTKSTTLYIRTKSTGTGATAVAASAPVSVIIPARPATPAPVYAPATDTITKVTTAMEYKTVGVTDAKFIPVTGTTLTRTDMKTATKITIRVPATEAAFASVEKDVTVPAKNADTVDSAKVKFDASTEKVVGILSTMEYKIAKADAIETAKWTKAKSGDLDISKLLNVTNALEMQIRYSAIPSGKTASEAITIALPIRGAVITAGDVVIDYATLKAEIPTTAEYSTDKKTWLVGKADSDISKFLGTKATPLYVRTAVAKDGDGKVTTLASIITTINILPRAAKPAVSYAAATDSIKVKDTMEYSLGKVDGKDVWVSVPAKTTVLTRTDIGTGQVSLSIRTKAVENKSIPSEVVEIIVPGEETRATGAKFDAKTEMITGLLSTMEYRITDEDADEAAIAKAKWTAAKSGDLNISKLLSYDKKKNLEVRFKAVGGKPATKADAAIVIPKRGAKIETIPAVDYVNAKLPLTEKQEYSTDKINWTKATGDLDLKAMISTKGFTLYVRTAAVVDESIASEMVSVSIGAKAAAPKASYDGKTNTIKSVSDKMEYKAPGADEYTAVSGKTISDLGEGTYSVRVKATLKTFASDDTVVTIY